MHIEWRSSRVEESDFGSGGSLIKMGKEEGEEEEEKEKEEEEEVWVGVWLSSS